jgi:hypothetical protein
LIIFCYFDLSNGNATSSPNCTRKKPKMNFRTALIEELAKVPRHVRDVQIAKSAGIDPSTLSTLKSERGRIKKPDPDLRIRLAIAIAKAQGNAAEGFRIAEGFLSDILAGQCLADPPHFWSSDEKANWTVRFGRLNLATPREAWSKEDILELWPRAAEKLRGFARIFEQHDPGIADRLGMALQLAEVEFQRLLSENPPAPTRRA